MSQMNVSESVTPLSYFNIQKKISSSKYSVFKAIDLKQNKEVALKMYPTIQEDAQSHFERESKFISQLDHPHIVKLNEAFSDSKEGLISHNYISLEFAKHGDLFENLCKHGAMSESLSRTFFLQLLSGVAHMHSRGLAHLDLKVDNLLLDENYNLKVTDFDLSQPISEENNKNALESRRGTPGSRAPEVKDGSCKNFVAADVYSLGVILFILFSGSPAYSEVEKRGMSEFDNFYKVMRLNNARFWEAHAKHRKNLDYYGKEFKELINWMLSENPRDRPTIEQIRAHAWCQEGALEGKEFEQEINSYLNKAI